jgi:hypothetical protein
MAHVLRGPVRLVTLALGAVMLSATVGCTVNITTPPKATPAPAPAPSTGAPAVSSDVKAGDTVAAPWGGGTYLGTVESVSGDIAKVLYADDKVVRDVTVGELRVVTPRTWKTGDKVLAVWTTGKFYTGTVTADKGGGVYTVKWDDGSTPSDVVAAKIIEP